MEVRCGFKYGLHITTTLSILTLYRKMLALTSLHAYDFGDGGNGTSQEK